jgi:hypothetical protein
VNRSEVTYDQEVGKVNLKAGELTPSGPDYVVTPAALGNYIPKSLASAADQVPVSTAASTWSTFATTSAWRTFLATVKAAWNEAAGTFAALLRPPAGTAAANTAPIKLTAGTNMTAPEAGALEFDGSNWYITIGATRYTIATTAGLGAYLPLAGGALTGKLSISKNWTDATGLLDMTGSETAGWMPIRLRNTANPASTGAQSGFDVGFSDSRRFTFACGGNAVGGPFWNNAAYFWATGNSAGINFGTADSTPVTFWTNGTSRGGFTAGGIFQPSAGFTLPKTSGTGIKVDQTTPTFPWHDIIGPVVPKATGAGHPTRTLYRGTNLYQFAFAANDVADYTFHVPHDYVPGTDLYIHVHWSHNGTAINGTATFDFYTTYAKGHNASSNGNFAAEKNVSVSYATVDVATTPQYRHRIDEVQLSSNGGSATLIDSAIIEPDGLLFGLIKVSSLPTITGGNLFIHTVDLHYQSTAIGTKQKSPPFWT